MGGPTYNGLDPALSITNKENALELGLRHFLNRGSLLSDDSSYIKLIIRRVKTSPPSFPEGRLCSKLRFGEAEMIVSTVT